MPPKLKKLKKPPKVKVVKQKQKQKQTSNQKVIVNVNAPPKKAPVRRRAAAAPRSAPSSSSSTTSSVVNYYTTSMPDVAPQGFSSVPLISTGAAAPPVVAPDFEMPPPPPPKPPAPPPAPPVLKPIVETALPSTSVLLPFAPEPPRIEKALPSTSVLVPFAPEPARPPPVPKKEAVPVPVPKPEAPPTIISSIGKIFNKLGEDKKKKNEEEERKKIEALKRTNATLNMNAGFDKPLPSTSQFIQPPANMGFYDTPAPVPAPVPTRTPRTTGRTIPQPPVIIAPSMVQPAQDTTFIANDIIQPSQAVDSDLFSTTGTQFTERSGRVPFGGDEVNMRDVIGLQSPVASVIPEPRAVLVKEKKKTKKEKEKEAEKYGSEGEFGMGASDVEMLATFKNIYHPLREEAGRPVNVIPAERASVYEKSTYIDRKSKADLQFMSADNGLETSYKNEKTGREKDYTRAEMAKRIKQKKGLLPLDSD